MMLTVLLLTPVLAVLLHAILPARGRIQAQAGLALQTLYGLLLLAAAVLWFFSPEDPRWILETPALRFLDLSFTIRPGLQLFAGNAPLVLLAGLAIPFVFFWLRASYADAGRGFFISAAILELGVVGAFLASSLVTFYVFFEISLIGAYFWIGLYGDRDTSNGKGGLTRFFLFTLVGSLALLAAAIALVSVVGADPHLFDLAPALALLEPGVRMALACGFLLAFAIKTPLFGLHGWLYDAYCAAPPVARALLSGLLSKLGVYGLFIVGIGFRTELAHAAPYLQALAAAGALYGGLAALGRTRLLDVLIYSSLSHLNLIALAFFLDDFRAPAAGAEFYTLSAGLFQMLNHGLILAALFAWDARMDDAPDSGVFASRRRLTALIFAGALAAVSLPGLSSFAGELIILGAAAERSLWLVAPALLGLLFSAMALFRALHARFFGETQVQDAGADVSRGESLVGALLIALWIGLGLAPRVLLAPIERGLGGFFIGM